MFQCKKLQKLKVNAGKYFFKLYMTNIRLFVFDNAAVDIFNTPIITKKNKKLIITRYY